VKKRYNSIESKNRFEGLESYKDAPYLSLQSKKIDVSLQTDCFNPSGKGSYSGSNLTYVIGNFFEKVSKSKYGGEGQKAHDVNDPNGHCKPDITISNGKRIVEVKGRNRTYTVPLLHRQMARYAMAKLEGILKPEIQFDFYRYQIPNVSEEFMKGGLEWIIETFPKNINFLLSLPFPAVFAMWNPKITPLTVSRKNPETSVKYSFFKQFLSEPEECLASLGESAKDYVIERNRFPPDLFIN